MKLNENFRFRFIRYYGDSTFYSDLYGLVCFRRLKSHGCAMISDVLEDVSFIAFGIRLSFN